MSPRLHGLSLGLIAAVTLAGLALWQHQWTALAIDAVIRFCS